MLFSDYNSDDNVTDNKYANFEDTRPKIDHTKLDMDVFEHCMIEKKQDVIVPFAFTCYDDSQSSYNQIYNMTYINSKGALQESVESLDSWNSRDSRECVTAIKVADNYVQHHVTKPANDNSEIEYRHIPSDVLVGENDETNKLRCIHFMRYELIYACIGGDINPSPYRMPSQSLLKAQKEHIFPGMSSIDYMHFQHCINVITNNWYVHYVDMLTAKIYSWHIQKEQWFYDEANQQILQSFFHNMVIDLEKGECTGKRLETVEAEAEAETGETSAFAMMEKHKQTHTHQTDHLCGCQMLTNLPDSIKQKQEYPDSKSVLSQFETNMHMNSMNIDNCIQQKYLPEGVLFTNLIIQEYKGFTNGCYIQYLDKSTLKVYSWNVLEKKWYYDDNKFNQLTLLYANQCFNKYLTEQKLKKRLSRITDYIAV